MQKLYKLTFFIIGFCLLNTNAIASISANPLQKANNSLTDIKSLQRGAILFAKNCLACHSLKYTRFNRISRDLGWQDKEVIEKMAFGKDRVVSTVLHSVPKGVQAEVFGSTAPDLSLMARLKGADYIYSFLLSFERNSAGQWDNRLLHGTSMPYVLEGMQRHLTPDNFKKSVRDIVNFLEYVAEPAKLIRWNLGWKVMLYLFILFILTYLLKREYWKDIK